MDTACLVTVVRTVVHFVTLLCSMDAGPIPALEFIRSAGHQRAVLLVRFVLAVFVPITLPVKEDAFAIATLELVSSTGVEGLGIIATPLYGLIRMVLTVCLVVTDPQLWDAHAVVALELIGAAGQRGAFLFITAITTVVVTITHEVDGDARLVTALELIRRTSRSTTSLINTAFTVLLPITSPGRRDTFVA